MSKFRVSLVDTILLCTTAIWGVNTVIMKMGLAHLAPEPYNAARMVVAIMVSWLMVFISKKHRPVERQDWGKLFQLSFFGFFVFQMLFTAGLNKTTAGNTALMLGLLPVSVALINRIFNIEPIRWPTALGIAISMIGVVLIILGTGKQLSLAGTHVIGGAMLLIAQFGYGYYTVFSKAMLEKYSIYQVTAYVVTIAGILFLLVSMPSIVATNWSVLPAIAWWSILFSGAFAICVGNFLWVWGVSILGSTKTAVYNNLPPVFAITTGYLFLGEQFGLLQLIGAIVVFLGVYITRTKGHILGEDGL